MKMEYIQNHNIKQTEDFMLYDYIFKCIEIVCIDNIELNKKDYFSLLNFLYNYKITNDLDYIRFKLMEDILYIKELQNEDNH